MIVSNALTYLSSLSLSAGFIGGPSWRTRCRLSLRAAFLSAISPPSWSRTAATPRSLSCGLARAAGYHVSGTETERSECCVVAPISVLSERYGRIGSEYGFYTAAQLPSCTSTLKLLVPCFLSCFLSSCPFAQSPPFPQQRPPFPGRPSYGQPPPASPQFPPLPGQPAQGMAPAAPYPSGHPYPPPPAAAGMPMGGPPQHQQHQQPPYQPHLQPGMAPPQGGVMGGAPGQGGAYQWNPAAQMPMPPGAPGTPGGAPAGPPAVPLAGGPGMQVSAAVGWCVPYAADPLTCALQVWVAVKSAWCSLHGYHIDLHSCSFKYLGVQVWGSRNGRLNGSLGVLTWLHATPVSRSLSSSCRLACSRRLVPRPRQQHRSPILTGRSTPPHRGGSESRGMLMVKKKMHGCGFTADFMPGWPMWTYNTSDILLVSFILNCM